MDFLGVPLPAIDRIGAVGTIVGFAVLIITDKLVWHTRYKNALRQRDKWEGIALEALRTGAVAGVTAAEVTAGVVSAIPDPERDRERSEKVDNP